jgi:hypothetical protein
VSKRTQTTLLLAGVILIIALTPSVSDMIEAHQTDLPHKGFLWLWVGGAILVAVLYGEVALGLRKPGK